MLLPKECLGIEKNWGEIESWRVAIRGLFILYRSDSLS